MKISATWSVSRGEETKITFSPDFDRRSWIERADFLNDVIGDLTRKYDALFDKENIEELGRQK